MEEAVAGTSTVAPLPGIESVINLDDGIDADNLIDSIDPIGAPSDPSTHPIQKYPLLLLVIRIEVPGIRA
jgi:hypothetical protein